MNTVRKHSCLLVNWNGRPFPLTSSRRWCCISLFQAVALVVVIVLNYFWPLDVGVLHALLFLFAVVRSTFRRFEIIRVATHRVRPLPSCCTVTMFSSLFISMILNASWRKRVSNFLDLL